MSALKAFVLTDNVLKVSGLINSVSSSYLNSATVTATIIDAISSAQVTGETWPIALSYVSASNGDYRATLTNSLAFVDGGRYIAVVNANAGVGLVKTWHIDVRADWAR